MDFYIKNNKRNLTMTLPITPEKYEIEYKIDIETVRLTNFGDINIPTHHTPMVLTLEGLFSVNENHYLNQQTLPSGAIQHAMDYVILIKSWIDNKDIVRVVITKDIKTRIDLDFHIEGIQYIEDGETVGDIKYTITFREYRPLKVNTIATTKAMNAPVRTNTKVAIKQKIYTVQSGDSLFKISRKFYGSGSKWKDIYNANKKIIGKNPNRIYPGQKLIIP